MSFEALLLDSFALLQFLTAILSIIAVLSLTRTQRFPTLLLNLDWLVTLVRIMLDSVGLGFLWDVWAPSSSSANVIGSRRKISGGAGNSTAGLALGISTGLFGIGWGRKGLMIENSNNKHCIKRQWNKPTKKGYQELVYGLVNTGNSCFLNSVLQALSSLDTLQIFLQDLLLGSESLEPANFDKSLSSTSSNNAIRLPVTEALLTTLSALSAPLNRRSSMRPTRIVTALSSHMFVVNREQQDAQELFQMISTAIADEGQRVEQLKRKGQVKGLLDPEVVRGLLLDERLGVKRPNIVKASPFISGLRSSVSVSSMASLSTTVGALKTPSSLQHHRNPLMGMMASRLSCAQCGYTEAIRHFTFDNLQLTLPSSYSCTLEQTLASYTRIEHLNDVICSRCSLMATLHRIESEMLVMHTGMMSEKNVERKRERIQNIVEWERRRREVERRLKENVQEELGDDIKMTKVVSRHSTKQIMLAKPPPILCLHINRSTYHYSGATFKNSCEVTFPEYLDVTPFSTTGSLSTRPGAPISETEEISASNASSANDSQAQLPRPRYFYKLMSSVVHFGSHSFGHYIAYRRKPKNIGVNTCACEGCALERVKEATERIEGGDGDCVIDEGEEGADEEEWFRISDERVEPCGIQDVLRANPFMLLYERVLEEDVDKVMTKLRATKDEGQAQVRRRSVERHKSFWGRNTVSDYSEDDEDDRDESEFDDLPSSVSSSSEDEEVVTRTTSPTPLISSQHRLPSPTMYYGNTSLEASEAERIANILLYGDDKAVPATLPTEMMENSNDSIEAVLVDKVAEEVDRQKPVSLEESGTALPAESIVDIAARTPFPEDGPDPHLAANARDVLDFVNPSTTSLDLIPIDFNPTPSPSTSSSALIATAAIPCNTQSELSSPSSQASVSYTSVEEGDKATAESPRVAAMTKRGKRKEQQARRREREGSAGAVASVPATVVTVN